MRNDLVGPWLRFKRLGTAINRDATNWTSGLAFYGMDDALAAEEVMARRSNSVVNVLEAYRALQLLLECFDIRLHLRVKLLFAPGFNDHRARSLRRARPPPPRWVVA